MSRECGFRTFEETIRLVVRLIVLTCPALSNSSLLEMAEHNAEGIKNPLILISSNFCSRIAIFVAEISFFLKSTLNLSPENKENIPCESRQSEENISQLARIKKAA